MKAPSNEFWPAMVEKAYAKFYGSYGAIEGGHCSEAMVDFTGGVVERYKLRDPPMKLFSIILKALKRRSLISVAVNRSNATDGARRRKGIISGHAYSLTAARIINAGSKKEVKIVRVKNPWSNEIEWNGRFSDKSIEWQFISKEIQRELKLQFEDDGEFFMIFNDFLENFDHIEFCHVSPGQLVLEDEGKQWFLTSLEEMFNAEDNFFPQIVVKLVDPDEHDDDDYCTLVLSLMQLNCRNTGLEHSAVGFDIYKLNDDDFNQTFLNREFFTTRKLVGSNKFEHFREICVRFRLVPGYYVIIPKTLTYASRKFMLRIFTESMIQSEHSKIIVKVNKKPQNLKNETRIEMFTEEFTPTAASAAPQSPRSPSMMKICFWWWASIVFTVVTMFVVSACFIIYFDKGSISLRHF